MAGRGVDIILGGSPPVAAETEEVRKLGGLHIIGTERHESRRIDNQLRGRAGRQGDPGSSRFYVALEDELMRLFGSERIANLMDRFNIEEDVPIEHPWITKAIENAQVKVESHHFDIRKNVKEYDDVMNEQRSVIYTDRRRILEGEDLKGVIDEMVDKIVGDLVDVFCPDDVPPEEWDSEGLFKGFKEEFGHVPEGASEKDLAVVKADLAEETLIGWVEKLYSERETKLSSDVMRHLERFAMLRSIDEKWIDHLYSMDMLREGVGLRAYGQKDPKVEYINEAFYMFEELKDRIASDTIQFLFRVQVHLGPPPGAPGGPGHGGPGQLGPNGAPLEPVPMLPLLSHAPAMVTHTNREEGGGAASPVRRTEKIGRNDACPCGSGKKYKKCCGAAG
jgi:preprotein translocase subunit SecA